MAEVLDALPALLLRRCLPDLCSMVIGTHFCFMPVKQSNLNGELFTSLRDIVHWLFLSQLISSLSKTVT